MKIVKKIQELNIVPYQYFLAKENNGKLINDTIFVISNTLEISAHQGFKLMNNDINTWFMETFRKEKITENLFVVTDGKNKGFYKKDGNKLYRYEGFKRVSDKVYNYLEMDFIKFEQLTTSNRQDWIHIYSEIEMMQKLQKAFFPDKQQVKRSN
ncbi:MAG: hypothetical protein LRY26_01315 [Bacilli bacterium]|nr:hypothetical protein [Bacilli bacterium]